MFKVLRCFLWMSSFIFKGSNPSINVWILSRVAAPRRNGLVQQPIQGFIMQFLGIQTYGVSLLLEWLNVMWMQQRSRILPILVLRWWGGMIDQVLNIRSELLIVCVLQQRLKQWELEFVQEKIRTYNGWNCLQKLWWMPTSIPIVITPNWDKPSSTAKPLTRGILHGKFCFRISKCSSRYPCQCS